MATQYGTTRIYTDKTEADHGALVQCPLCHVNVVPRGIAGSRTTDTTPGTHCPNCGHIFTPIRPESPAE